MAKRMTEENEKEAWENNYLSGTCPYCRKTVVSTSLDDTICEVCDEVEQERLSTLISIMEKKYKMQTDKVLEDIERFRKVIDVLLAREVERGE